MRIHKALPFPARIKDDPPEEGPVQGPRRIVMKDWQSQAHVKWDCKYHVVIVPKYRKRVFFGRRRKQIGEIFRDLCRQKEIGLI